MCLLWCVVVVAVVLLLFQTRLDEHAMCMSTPLGDAMQPVIETNWCQVTDVENRQILPKAALEVMQNIYPLSNQALRDPERLRCMITGTSTTPERPVTCGARRWSSGTSTTAPCTGPLHSLHCA